MAHKKDKNVKNGAILIFHYPDHDSENVPIAQQGDVCCYRQVNHFIFNRI